MEAQNNRRTFVPSKPVVEGQEGGRRSAPCPGVLSVMISLTSSCLESTASTLHRQRLRTKGRLDDGLQRNSLQGRPFSFLLGIKKSARVGGERGAQRVFVGKSRAILSSLTRNTHRPHQLCLVQAKVPEEQCSKICRGRSDPHVGSEASSG